MLDIDIQYTWLLLFLPLVVAAFNWFFLTKRANVAAPHLHLLLPGHLRSFPGPAGQDRNGCLHLAFHFQRLLH